MTTGKQRGPYAKSAVQQENILNAARRTFARLGYNGSSLRGIAEEANITFAGLRHHFPTKDALLIAVLEQRDHEHQAQQEQLHGAAFLNDLGRLLEQSLGEPAITEIFTTLSGEAVSRDHPAHAFFVERYERIRRQFGSELHRAVEAGTELTLDADHAAVLLAAVMDGLQLQWLLDEKVDAHVIFDEFVALLKGAKPGT